MCINAAGLQRFEYRGTGIKRHFSFAGKPAEHYGNSAEFDGVIYHDA
jgi:hypothetical protein